MPASAPSSPTVVILASVITMPVVDHAHPNNLYSGAAIGSTQHDNACHINNIRVAVAGYYDSGIWDPQSCHSLRLLPSIVMVNPERVTLEWILSRRTMLLRLRLLGLSQTPARVSKYSHVICMGVTIPPTLKTVVCWNPVDSISLFPMHMGTGSVAVLDRVRTLPLLEEI